MRFPSSRSPDQSWFFSAVVVACGVACVAGCKPQPASVDMLVPAQDLSVALDFAPAADLTAPTCSDGIQNGRETGVDCGGDCVTKCDLGHGCQLTDDCSAGICIDFICTPPSCTDSVMNGDETGVDCGGSCTARCRDGEGCATSANCKSLVCTSLVCQPPGCGDTIKNGSETDVDCGGGACEKCSAGKSCTADLDCATQLCDGATKSCIGCGDEKRNGGETDVDCGGSLCHACALGKGCAVNTDCASNLCLSGTCQFDYCADGQKDRKETDVDCGGSECKGCPGKKTCAVDADCLSKMCQSGSCATQGTVLGVLGPQTFFKVQVSGTMTDTNVYNACINAGLNVGCCASSSCMYDDNLCVMTQESECFEPMYNLSLVLCPGNFGPWDCSPLENVFQYMGHQYDNQDSASGCDQFGDCDVAGAQVQNAFALCVQ